jgi:molybdopterin synthase catalytic subunit
VIVRVQSDAFDSAALKQELNNVLTGQDAGLAYNIGAMVEFTGFVRADKVSAQEAAVTAIELEHYPAMTYKALDRIIAKAIARFDCYAVILVHRIGVMQVGEPIVYVAVASQHRKQSFQAAEFLMDYLKSEVPLWKREFFSDSSRWVDQKLSDVESQSRWD